MMITRENYESFFLDYLENRLDENQKAKLQIFLEKNPDLKEELCGMELIPLTEDDPIVFEDKHLLKKNTVISVGKINRKTCQEYFIASAENDLDKTDTILLHRFLDRNPFLKPEYELFRKMHLAPDCSIIYPDKKSLKKGFLVFLQTHRSLVYSVAAAIIVLLLWISFPGNKKNERMNEFSEIVSDKPVIPQVTTADNISKETSADVSGASGLQDDLTAITEENPEILKEPSAEMAEKPEQPEIKIPDPGKEILLIKPLPELEYNVPEKVDPAASVNNKEIISMERQYYSQIFPYIRTAEDYYLTDAERPEETEEYQSFLSFAYSRLKKMFLKRSPEQEHDNRISFWTIADLGITGINQLTHRDIQLDRLHDENGNVVAYNIVSDNLVISKPQSERDKDKKK